jgi:hypothetical protein
MSRRRSPRALEGFPLVDGQDYPRVCGIDGCERELGSASFAARHREYAHGLPREEAHVPDDATPAPSRVLDRPVPATEGPAPGPGEDSPDRPPAEPEVKEETVANRIHCDEPGCDAGPFRNPQALGAHRRYEHPADAMGARRQKAPTAAPESAPAKRSNGFALALPGGASLEVDFGTREVAVSKTIRVPLVDRPAPWDDEDLFERVFGAIPSVFQLKEETTS